MTRQAADDLRELLAVYAEPILRERGWKGSGRRFTRSNEVGDVALVRFAPWQLPDVVSFNVELAVVPALWARWRTSADLRGSGGLTEADGLWRSRLDPLPHRTTIARPGGSTMPPPAQGPGRRCARGSWPLRR